MTNILIDAEHDESTRRNGLYSGDIYVYSATAATRALCELAAELAREAFHPHAPATAQHDLPVENRRIGREIADSLARNLGEAGLFSQQAVHVPAAPERNARDAPRDHAHERQRESDGGPQLRAPFEASTTRTAGGRSASKPKTRE